MTREEFEILLDEYAANYSDRFADTLSQRDIRNRLLAALCKEPTDVNQEFVDSMFSACCYLDRAIPVYGYEDNAQRVRAATDEILRLRALCKDTRCDCLVSRAQILHEKTCASLQPRGEKR